MLCTNLHSYYTDGPIAGAIVLSKQLDRELLERVSFYAVATNSNGLYCRTNLRISVTDVNDSPPVFSKNIYNVSVMENLEEQAHFLIRVSANDPDLGGYCSC